jgi:L-amino acid N-acyltransferase YncA
MVNLRLATMADSNRLLIWRNDPETIAQSLSPDPVDPEHHAKWMDRWVRTGFPAGLVLIALDNDGKPIGVVRFEARARWTFEVSITIAPWRRGQRLGYKILHAACAPMAACELIAQIKTGNHASRRIFECNGFVQIDAGGGIEKYRKAPCLIP